MPANRTQSKWFRINEKELNRCRARKKQRGYKRARKIDSVLHEWVAAAATANFNVYNLLRWCVCVCAVCVRAISMCTDRYARSRDINVGNTYNQSAPYRSTHSHMRRSLFAIIFHFISTISRLCSALRSKAMSMYVCILCLCYTWYGLLLLLLLLCRCSYVCAQ